MRKSELTFFLLFSTDRDLSPSEVEDVGRHSSEHGGRGSRGDPAEIETLLMVSPSK